MERYLEPGEKLELKGIDGQYVIKKILGRGSSCVVYTAEFYNSKGEKTEHLLKEFNPKCIELKRENGILSVVREEDAELFNKLLERFKDGFNRQSQLREVPELKNYTANIQNTYYDHGTVYIDMTVTNGQSYANPEFEETSLLNLAKRIKVLSQVIGAYHKQGYLHLDIKPSNIFVRPVTETCEDVLLFDFDSFVPFTEVDGKCVIDKAVSVSYTCDYAPIEVLSASRRSKICRASDIYEIGEVFFEKLMGRHSTALEHNILSEYEFNLSSPLFENINRKVVPLLTELFRRTLCNNVAGRYQTTEELIAKLDEIIAIADPKAPYLKSSPPAVQDFFVGRDSEIAEINEKLGESRILFLSGIGGIGKSELAKQYANKYESDYDVVLFAPYISDVNMLLQDDTAIPIYNFSKYPEEKPEEYCARKLKKLQELCDERTLIIVDNLDRSDDPDLHKLLDLNCKLLITTRMDFTDYGYGKQIYIDALTDRDKIREIFNKHYTKTLTEEENACVEQIIDLVAGHTMTVELLAKQMMAGRVKPDKMLEKLKEGGISESGKEKVRSGKDGIFSVQSVYSHIQALFNFSELDENERDILVNLSLMPYTGVSTGLFNDWCELQDCNTLNSLINAGIVHESDSDSISLHPVIAESISRILSVTSDSYTKMLVNAKEWVSDSNLCALNSADLKYRADLVLYVAHKLISLNVETEAAASFLNRVPSVFWKYGKLQFAISCRDRALQIRLRLLGEFNSDTATSYFNLGRMYKEVGDYQIAEDNYRKSLDIRQTLFGEEHEDTASSYNALGVLYKERGQFDIAEKYELNALHIREEVLGEKDEDVASSYNNLAVLYRELQKYEISEKFHFKALEIRKHLFGEKHEDTATSYNNLGVLYTEWNRLHDAEQYLLKALEVRRHIFGEVHISTASTCTNIGDLYRKLEQFGSAKNFYQKALKIRTALFGENHKKTTRIKKKIAKLPEGPTRFTVRQNNVRTLIQEIFESSTSEKSRFYSKERCPDQIVAKIRISKAANQSINVEFIDYCQTKCQRKVNGVSVKSLYKRRNISDISTKNDFARIVLILESPHKNEFNPETPSNPTNGPAYGITGDNINKFLSEIILNSKELSVEEGTVEYEIALVNAIQYQCSLGERTSKYRDKIFWMCWKHEDVRIDFCDRIHMALGTPNKKNIVVNCCTIGNLARSNHDLINIALEDMGISFFEITHPYGWINESKRQLNFHANQ